MSWLTWVFSDPNLSLGFFFFCIFLIFPFWFPDFALACGPAATNLAMTLLLENNVLPFCVHMGQNTGGGGTTLGYLTTLSCSFCSFLCFFLSVCFFFFGRHTPSTKFSCIILIIIIIIIITTYLPLLMIAIRSNPCAILSFCYRYHCYSCWFFFFVYRRMGVGKKQKHGE